MVNVTLLLSRTKVLEDASSLRSTKRYEIFKINKQVIYKQEIEEQAEAKTGNEAKSGSINITQRLGISKTQRKLDVHKTHEDLLWQTYQKTNSKHVCKKNNQ